MSTGPVAAEWAGKDRDSNGRHTLSFDRIRRLLPHREPFVMIDRVLTLEPGLRIVCIKNVTGAEPIFASHFPTHAIFPGVFIVEAMAQAAAILLHGSRMNGQSEGQLPVLAAVKARWIRPVQPGDQLKVSVVVDKATTVGAVVSGEATVEGQQVARARLTLGTARMSE
jgi:3-hydroxyacyl-[acyl-carrier-protein] dehydratase